MGVIQNMFCDPRGADMKKPKYPDGDKFMEPNPFLWLIEVPPDFDADMQNSKCCGDLKFLQPKCPPKFVEVPHAKERTPTDLEDGDDVFLTGEVYFFLDATTQVKLGCDKADPSKTCSNLLSQHVAITASYQPHNQDAHGKIEADLGCDNRYQSKLVTRYEGADNASDELHSYHENCNPDLFNQQYGVSRRFKVPLDPPILSSGGGYSNPQHFAEKTKIAVRGDTPGAFPHSGGIDYSALLFIGEHRPLIMEGENCSTPAFVKIFDISSPPSIYSVQASYPSWPE
jgi:hypothetical protein